MKTLWEILVPTQWPTVFDGSKEIPVHYHWKWDDFVRQLTGGLTIMKSGKGVWEDEDGGLFKEQMIPVRIMCTQEQIEQIADFTASFYGQKAVMFYKITDNVVIYKYKNGQRINDNDNQTASEQTV